MEWDGEAGLHLMISLDCHSSHTQSAVHLPTFSLFLSPSLPSYFYFVTK